VSKKTNSKSKWDKLSETQKAELWDWLQSENISYEDAVARARERWGIQASTTSLCNWRSRYTQQDLLRRITESAAKANSVVNQFAANPSNTYDALLQLIGQTAFEAQLAGGEKLDLSTLKDLAELTALGLKAKHDTAKLDLMARGQEIDAQQLALARQKFEFDAAEACLAKLPELKVIAASSGLDQRQKIDAIREKLFGEVAA
jgi:hypothetical protein